MQHILWNSDPNQMLTKYLLNNQNISLFQITEKLWKSETTGKRRLFDGTRFASNGELNVQIKTGFALRKKHHSKGISA